MMAMVHTCALPDCETLTMGEYCLDHEPADRRNQQQAARARGGALLARLGPALALLAAATAGAFIRTHLPR